MKLTNRNYYSSKANQEYMSFSQFKQFNDCPAKAMAILKGEYKQEESESMLIGSYVDSWLDGELDKFKEQHPEIYNSRNGELKAGFKQAEELCEVIKQDKFLYDKLKGKRQVIITGNIAGVQFKGKIDSLKADCIVDGKVLKDCEDIWHKGEKKAFFKANGYDIQAAIYKTLYMQQTGECLPFQLAVVTKEKQPDKRVFVFSDETVDNALQEIIAKAPIFDDIKKGKLEPIKCCKCDFCLGSKKLSENDIETI